jgi:hypothetical protein
MSVFGKTFQAFLKCFRGELIVAFVQRQFAAAR